MKIYQVAFLNDLKNSIQDFQYLIVLYLALHSIEFVKNSFLRFLMPGSLLWQQQQWPRQSGRDHEINPI